MATSGNNLGAKKGKKGQIKYTCSFCDFECFKKYDWERHILTLKHSMETNGNQMETKKGQNIQFLCEKCGKEYKNRAGLWKHKQKCVSIANCNKEEINTNNDEINTNIDEINIKDKDALILHLLKQNSVLQNKIVDMNSQVNITNNNSNNTTNNIDNKTFNLQLFLNETCKNAMNITDFVSNIKLELTDLEHTGRRGYIEGVTNIIVKNLNNLEQHMRPLHCSDFKREILYIKDNNEWTKETETKPILTKTIKTIANENIKQINKWKEQNPGCTSADSKNNNLFLKIVSNSMNGLTKEEGDKNINKIITNVAKNVVIDK